MNWVLLCLMYRQKDYYYVSIMLCITNIYVQLCFCNLIYPEDSVDLYWSHQNLKPPMHWHSFDRVSVVTARTRVGKTMV